jgi:nitroreductase
MAETNKSSERDKTMMMKDLIRKNRTYRRYYQDVRIDRQQLLEWIDLARLSACGANMQPFKYVISTEQQMNDRIFKHLNWAAYLTEWSGPVDGERPSAYIVMLLDKKISLNCLFDHGIACQSILLGATEAGFGGCIFYAFDHAIMHKDLQIPDQFEVLLAIGLGKPKEIVVIEDVDESGSIKYYRDANGVHHVPKRKLEEMILNI